MARTKKAKATGKKFTCDLCGKTFSMAAHLGRHKSTIHGTKPKTARRRKAIGAAARRPGRPPAVATKFGLRDLSLDDLAALINAAKDEAGRRIAEFRDLLAK
jgi:hypothetical protein